MALTLVLLPGMDGTGELFGPFIQAMGSAQTVQVIRYPMDRPLGYAELVDWAAQQLPPDVPYVLLGESFAGPIAWRLAARADNRLKGLVLCCTYTRHPLAVLSPLAALCHALPWQMARGKWLEWAMLGHKAPLALRQWFRSAVAQVPAQVLSARAHAVLTLTEPPPPLPPGLPVLCLRALGDYVVPRVATERIRHLVPQARMVALPGSHGLLQVNPDGAAAAVSAFLQSLPRDVEGGACNAREVGDNA